MQPSSALATETPDIGALQLLFQTCAPVAHGWDRIRDNDNTRYTLWEGKSADGKKWSRNLPEGKLAFPFEGASDCAIPTADEIINDTVDYLTEGFWRSMARVQGNPETERSGQAAYARKLVDWVRATKLYGELIEEIELHAQAGCTYGVSLLQVGWERTLGYRLHEITMEDLLQLSAAALRRNQRSLLVHFPEMIEDKALDDDSAVLLQQIFDAYVQARKPSNFDWDAQPLTAARARKAIRELRKTGKAKLPLPYVCKNEPCIQQRTLWEDAFVPESTGKLQKAPAIFTLDYYGEADFRASAKANEWDAEWVEQAVKRKGEFSAWTPITALEQRVASIEFGYQVTDVSDLIEVTTAYEKKVDDDGVLGVYRTVYHGNILRAASGKRSGGYGSFGLLDYPIGTDYPFVSWRMEVNKRSLCASRGVPEITMTWQRNLKALEDACIDRTSLETVPPILVEKVMGVDYTFGPAVQIPVKRGNQKPEFMAITPGGKTAEFLMERIEQRVDRYFGRPRADQPPENALIKRQKRVRSFLLSCSQALAYVFKLMATHFPPEEIEQITGMPAGKFGEPESIASDVLYLLSYDVQELTPDFVAAKNKALVEIAMMDSTGTIDRARLTRHLLRAVDPSLEQEIATDVQGAQGQVLKQVKDDFANMMLGVPTEPTENDPTAPMQLQFAQQLVEVSPKYQIALQQDQNFKQLVEQWVKNKRFSLMQMENKQIGRVGVDPAMNGQRNE